MPSIAFATGNIPKGNAAAAVANSTAFKTVVFAAIVVGADLAVLAKCHGVMHSCGSGAWT
jgi:hypothetical protein